MIAAGIIFIEGSSDAYKKEFPELVKKAEQLKTMAKVDSDK